MKLFGLEVSWELIQTALLWARNRPSQPGPAATTAAQATRPDEGLTQQVATMLDRRSDEAILMAVDAALAQMSGGAEHLRRVQLVRVALAPHQQTDWRMNLTTIAMTERFENYVSERITELGNESAQAESLDQRRRNNKPRRPVVREKFDRRKIDYEWTPQDPRVQHLILVSTIVSAESEETAGVELAKKYLLSAGFIQAKSAAEKAGDATEKSTQAIARALYRSVAGQAAREGLIWYSLEIKRAERASDPKRVSELEIERDQFIIQASRKSAAKARKSSSWITIWWAGLALVAFAATMTGIYLMKNS